MSGSESNHRTAKGGHVLKPETPKRNHRKHRNETTETTGITEPPKTRRREPQKVPKVIKQTVSITEAYVSSTNNERSTGMEARSPEY